MPFPTSVDAILDAPPLTAATVIHASQVLGPQRITVGPAFFNVRSDQYGAVGDGTTDDTVAIQAAITACQNAGGGIVLIPQPSVAYRTTAALNITANVRMLIWGWGSLIQPTASTDAIFVRTANGATALGCEIHGLIVDGQSRVSTTGIHIRDSDRVIVRSCRIVNCTTGILVESFTAARFAEDNAVMDTFILSCTTGISFAAPGGTLSLGETYMANVGISNCTTGLALNTPGIFYRCRLLGITIWLPTNGVGLLLDCNITDSMFIIDFENLSGTQTGLTGVNVTANAIGVDTLDAHLGFTGTFATPVSDTAAKGLVWSEGTHRNTSTAGNGIWGALRILGDSLDRVRYGTQFAGGGGMQLGNGTVIDVNLYRGGLATLKTDGAFARSRQSPAEAVLVSGINATAGEFIFVTLTAARLVGAPTNALAGQCLTYTLVQGGAGGFAVTWNAVFKVSWSDVGNAVGTRSSVSFSFDGTNWNQIAAQAPYV